jgi:hypothetical protein
LIQRPRTRNRPGSDPCLAPEDFSGKLKPQKEAGNLRKFSFHSGTPTTDPQVALKGAMLPVAGYKGIGLAMLVQALAGSLSGSQSAESAASFGAASSAGNISAFLLVINPDRVIGRAAFDAHVAQWLSHLQRRIGHGRPLSGRAGGGVRGRKGARRHPAADGRGRRAMQGRRTRKYALRPTRRIHLKPRRISRMRR